MSINIAVTGKGGSGKTSVASLIIRYLIKKSRNPILAVDADPNMNLGESLGLTVRETIGSLIASFNEEKINIPAGMTKEAYLDVKLNDVIIESKELDLLTMGRGEGAECYCYPNLILRKFIDTMTDNYTYTVIDNEAGLEHLSRRTTQSIDELIIVASHSIKSIRAVARVKELVTELKLDVRRQSVIINMVPDKLDPLISEELASLGINIMSIIPLDEVISDYDLKQKSLLDLPKSAIAVKAIDDFMVNYIDKN